MNSSLNLPKVAKKAVIYTRVSSEEQVENFSLKTQEEICRRDAKYKGFEIVQVFKEEGKSAKTIAGRPELLNMLDYLRKNKKEIRALFIYRLDRLSRQTADYLAIRKRLYDYNIVIISANEPTGNSPTEKLLETVLASFAQHDNDVRSERTKNGLRARFLAGLVTNHVPWGYLNKHGFAVKDPKKYETIKKAWELMATGSKSLSEMSKIMADWGIKANPQTLQHMFRNKFYMGILTSSKYPEEIKGQHSSMISKELFYQVQAILDGRNTSKHLLVSKRTRDNEDFKLRRIVRCGLCDTPFTGAWSRCNKKRHAYYFCRKRCITKSERVSTIEDTLKEKLYEYKPTKEGIKIYCDYLEKYYNKKMANLNKIKAKADEEIQRLYTLRQVLIEKNLSGTFSDQIFKEQNQIIEEKLIGAEAAKNEALIDKYDMKAIREFIETKILNLPDTFEHSNVYQTRSLLHSIFMSGFAWNYPGYSNGEISPFYQPILDASSGGLNDSSATRIRT